MVGEIVVHRDAADRAAQLEAAAHVREDASARRCPGGDAGVLGRGDRGERVELVVFAEPRHSTRAILRLPRSTSKAMGRRARSARRLLAGAEAHHLAPAPLQHAPSASRGR